MSLNIYSEENEMTKNARGGTELMMEGLYKHVDNDLLNEFQIIPSRMGKLEDKKRLLWLHDLAQDPAAQHLKERSNRNKFDKLIFVSNWQQQMFNLILGVPYSDGIVLRNAIEPLPVYDKGDPKEELRIIYHTTPHRGLDILVHVFKQLADVYPNIVLDVYSSFSLYGWDHRDEPFEELFNECREHPQINYHGAVSHEEVKEAVAQSHIFAYPSTWLETSCISAIEAMSGRNIVVNPNLGALPETCANWSLMYNWHEDKNEHARVFAMNLEQAINITMENTNQLITQLDAQKAFFDSHYGWDKRAIEWTHLLKSLKGE